MRQLEVRNEPGSLDAVHVVQHKFLILRGITRVPDVQTAVEHAHGDGLRLRTAEHQSVAHGQRQPVLPVGGDLAFRHEHAFHLGHGHGAKIVRVFGVSLCARVVHGHGHKPAAQFAHRGMGGPEPADGRIPQRLDRLRHATRQRLQTHGARRRKRQRAHGGVHRFGVAWNDGIHQALFAQVVEHARQGGGGGGRSGCGDRRRGRKVGVQFLALARQRRLVLFGKLEREQPMAVVARGSQDLPS